MCKKLMSIIMLLIIANIGYADVPVIPVCQNGDVVLTLPKGKKESIIAIYTDKGKLETKDFKDAKNCFDTLKKQIDNDDEVILLIGRKGAANLAIYLVKTEYNTQAIVYNPIEFPKEIEKKIGALPKISKDGHDISGDRDIEIIIDDKN
ncbi:hypothetical protein [Oceanivirga salmonicida]|uniref:hypothetical protein n=1 Tax=Oceanivirga salmonicida TaxID=1769291 RepID=UPI0012E17813|nr:hypothetical protein [Oceanivirga salmonicida]